MQFLLIMIVERHVKNSFGDKYFVPTYGRSPTTYLSTNISLKGRFKMIFYCGGYRRCHIIDCNNTFHLLKNSNSLISNASRKLNNHKK